MFVFQINFIWFHTVDDAIGLQVNDLLDARLTEKAFVTRQEVRIDARPAKHKRRRFTRQRRRRRENLQARLMFARTKFDFDVMRAADDAH